MVVTKFPAPRSIVDIMDQHVAARTAERADLAGQLVRTVLAAAAPDDVLQDLMREMLSGFLSETRKIKITMVAAAFGADRREFKKYLRSAGVCGPMD